MMTSRRGERSVLSHCHTVHGQQHGAVLLGRIITVAMTSGGQQPVVIGGCIYSRLLAHYADLTGHYSTC
jgi:hypothetical protein